MLLVFGAQLPEHNGTNQEARCLSYSPRNTLTRCRGLRVSGQSPACAKLGIWLGERCGQDDPRQSQLKAAGCPAGTCRGVAAERSLCSSMWDIQMAVSTLSLVPSLSKCMKHKTSLPVLCEFLRRQRCLVEYLVTSMGNFEICS